MSENYDARCFCSCCCYDPTRSDEARLDCTCKVRRSGINEFSTVAELMAVFAVIAPPVVVFLHEALEMARGES
jgi:hypothetical protein